MLDGGFYYYKVRELAYIQPIALYIDVYVEKQGRRNSRAFQVSSLDVPSPSPSPSPPPGRGIIYFSRN